jgi:CheY-like chemotaxis protein
MDEELGLGTVAALDTGGCVLVADDEDLVRRVLTVCLEGYGFSVLSARDGREAVDLFRQSCDRIGIVVLDMTMPRMGGAEAFREIRQIRADVSVIITSGFAEENASGELGSEGVSGFLQKPFLAQDLIAKIQQVVGTPVI